jgi:hypothetical protein
MSSSLPRKKLPIGIQTFSELRQSNCYYADKTGLAAQLAQNGKCYFLSRPRRFGKSLLIDTFKELFEGNQALFTGLAAEQRWDWSQRHPVIHISFSDGVLQNRAELDQRMHEILSDNERRLGVTSEHQSLSGRFSELIRQAHATHGAPAVVLIDEYDKPILDNITEPETARIMREGLKNLYSVLKGSDAHLRFVFLTGVSKFSKVSLFSGLNQLQDITLDERYSTLCGYTDEELDTVFAPELVGLDRELVRTWYNGYNWLGASVYNPFDALLLFSHRRFRPYWFETGTPTFLIKILSERQVCTPLIGQMVATDRILSTFDVDTILPEALMFQAGYLTIDSVWDIPGRLEITLKYPNREVQSSLNDVLLGSLAGGPSIPGPNISKLYRLLQAGDVMGLRPLFHAFFASIPHDWYRKNQLSGFEGYYASIFYSHFAALGLEVIVEDATNHGQIDMTVIFGTAVWLFEFKVVELVPQGRALAQLQTKGYAQKYATRGGPIHLVGVEFSKTERNITGFEVQTLA